MIASGFERFRRALWTFRQPVTRHPTVHGAPISDLFLWRNSGQWQTFFELIDVPGLFAGSDSAADSEVKLVFFDAGGVQVHEMTIGAKFGERRCLSFSEIIPSTAGAFGTFCVFHAKTPDAVSGLGSCIAERGYVSYCFCGAPLRSYVHGNLDAVTKNETGDMEFLGSDSFFQREYRVQYLCIPEASHELVLVNPTSRIHPVNCLTLSVDGLQVLENQKTELQPGGSHTFVVGQGDSSPCRLVVRSRLVMARPLVFRIKNMSLDVFHG